MDDSRDSRQTRLTGHLDSGDGSPLSNTPPAPQSGSQDAFDGPAAHAPLAGNFGKYLIERILGEGAMGTVYLATDQDLQRSVALKIPKFGGGNTAELRERFFVEARAAAALRHTNLCPVYEVGELNDRCFLAMAYIDGRPLSDFVSPDHPLPIDQVATIVAQLADGLAHAHARGVIHRDLKPSNVIIDAQRQPILTDFGLARQTSDPDAARLTGAGMILGSPAYMSPEQASGEFESIGPLSDVYSLGVMLYELLTGRLPFNGSIAEVLKQVLTSQPEHPSTHRPGLDTDLETLCLKMMSKSTETRTESAAAVATELDAWLASRSDASESSGAASLSAFDPSRAVGDVRREKLEQDQHLANALIEQGRLSMAARIVDAMAGLDDPRYRDFTDWARSRKQEIQQSRRPGLVVSYTAADGTRFIDIGGRLFRARTIWSVTATLLVAAVAIVGWALSGNDAGTTIADNPPAAAADPSNRPDRVPGPTKQIISPPPGQAPETTTTTPLPTPPTPTPQPTPQTRPTPKPTPPTGDEELVLTGHTDVVRQVVFSSNGQLLVSGGEDNSVRVWDATSGRQMIACMGHKATVETVAINRQGSMIASGGADDLIRLWNSSTGKRLGILRGHEDSVTHVDFSPDGTMLVSAADDHTVRLWDLESFSEINLLNGHSDSVNVAIFNHDGSQLLSAGADTAVLIWDTRTGKQLSVLEGHTEEIWGAGFRGDGRQAVSCGDDYTIRIWDLETSRELAKLEGHSDEVNAACFSPNSRLIASAGVDGVIKIWDAVTYKELATLKGHTDFLWDVVFSPDGRRLASCAADGTVRVWNLPPELLAKVLKGHSEPVGQVAISPDGLLLASGSIDQTIRLWDSSSGSPGRVLAGHSHWVWGVAFGNSSRTLYSVGDTTLRSWNTDTGKQQSSIEVTDKQVRTLAVTPDGRSAVVGDNDGRVTIWDLASGELKSALTRHTKEVSGVAVSPDGKWIASAGFDGKLLIHSAADGKLTRTLKGSEAPLQCLAFRPDSRHIAAGSQDSEVFIWNVADGKPQASVADDDAGYVFRLAWSPDGRRLISAQENGKVLVRRPGDRGELKSFEAHQDGVIWVGVNRRSGELISAGFDRTIRLWPFLNANQSR